MSSIFKGKFTRIKTLGDWVHFVGARSLHHAMQYYSDYRPETFPCLMRRIGENTFMIFERADLNQLRDELNGINSVERPKGISNRMAKMLKLIVEIPYMGYTAEQVVGYLYDNTKQPHKKTVGVYKDLHWLAKNGVLSERGGSSAYRYTEVRFHPTSITQQVMESKEIPLEEAV